MLRTKTSLAMAFGSGYGIATNEVQSSLRIFTVPTLRMVQYPFQMVQLPTLTISVHTPFGRTIRYGPPRTCQTHELEPAHQEPALDADLIEKHQEFVLLLCPERLFVGGSAFPLATALLVVSLTTVGANSPLEHRLEHVVDGGLVTIPALHLGRTWDRIGGWELLLETLFERLEVVGDGKAVEMLEPGCLVPTVNVLVETPICRAEKPGDAGTTEGVFPTADVANVLS
jgi:hypothetical protein